MSKLKLLNRRELDSAKAKDRQKEIDEGKKLATRVDILRRTVADEERTLDQFRVTTVASIQTEIDGKIKEKDKLDEELAVRREERKALLKPLNAAWDDVNAQKESLAGETEALSQRKSALNAQVSTNIERERQLRIEEGRIADDRKSAHEFVQKAKKMNKDAASDLMNARTQSEILLSNAQAIEQGVLKREKNVSLLEGLVEQRRKANDVITRKNDEDRVRLRDAYATLERIKNRLK